VNCKTKLAFVGADHRRENIPVLCSSENEHGFLVCRQVFHDCVGKHYWLRRVQKCSLVWHEYCPEGGFVTARVCSDFLSGHGTVIKNHRNFSDSEFAGGRASAVGYCDVNRERQAFFFQIGEKCLAERIPRNTYPWTGPNQRSLLASKLLLTGFKS